MKIENNKKIQSNKSIYKWLAQSDTEGSFDFYTSIICLEILEESNFSELEKDKRHLKKVKKKTEKLNFMVYQKLKSIYPLAHHEYTHFIDSTSTLWGLNHLKSMNDAYIQDNTNHRTEETLYHKAKSFYDDLRSYKLPDYFTQIIAKSDDKRPWKYRESSGQRFSSSGHVTDYPIFFVTFLNSDEELLVRSPISIISILEASATAQELICTLDLISKLSPDAKTGQLRVYSKEMEAQTYNKELTEYSVCAHLVSNYQKCQCITRTFKACALISRLVLNFPKSGFSRIENNQSLPSLLRVYDTEYIARIYAGLKYKDHSTLFLIISRMLPLGAIDNIPEINEGITHVLKQLGLSREFVLSEARIEANEISEYLKESKIKSIATLAAAGIENFNLIEWNNSKLPFNKLNLPPAYLGDLSERLLFADNNDNKLKDLNLDDLCDELHKGQKWLEKFNEACL